MIFRLIILAFPILSLWKNDSDLRIIKIPSIFTPGKHHVVVMELTNSLSKNLSIEAEWILPENWRLITKPSINKKKETKNIRIFSIISVPVNFRSGISKLIIKVKHNNKTFKTKEINVKIKELHKIEVNLVEKPNFVRAGKKFFYKYLIENKGNTEEKINIESRFSEGKTESFDIPVSSSKMVSLEQYIEGDFTKPTTKLTDIIVTGKNIDTISKINSFTVYPNTSSRNDLYFYYPVTTVVNYTFLKNEVEKSQFLLYNVNGNGFLDIKKKHHLNIGTIRAGGDKSTRYENLERNWIKYKYKKNELYLGDFSFNFTRLLEQNRLGRGGYSKLYFKKFHFAFFYNTPLFFKEVKNQLGGYMKLNPFNNYNTSFGILNRVYDNTKTTTTLNITQSYKNAFSSLYLETAMTMLGKKKRIGLQFTGKAKLNNYEILSDILYTSPEFDGYFYNSSNIFTSIKKTFSKRFILVNEINYNFLNPRPDEIIEQIAPFNQRYFSRLYFVPNRGHRHSIELGYLSVKDRSKKIKFNFYEYLLNYQYKIKKNNFSLALDNGIRLSTNNLVSSDEKRKTSLQSSILGVYFITNNLILNTNVQYSNTNRYSQSKRNLLFYGGSLNYKIKNSWDLAIGFRNDYELSEQYKRRSLFNLTGKFKFNKNHHLNFAGNIGSSSLNTNSKDFLLSIGYRLNLNIPISKNKNIGDISGFLNSKSINDRSGIIFNLDGYSSITDDKGNFKFKDITTGKHYLSVDQSSLKFNSMINEDIPLEVTVNKKEEKQVKLSLIKPSKIGGKITFKKNNQTQASLFKNKLPQLIIKLAQDDKIKYTLTNNKNEFLFSQIKPGKYKIGIVSKNYEKKFTFSNNHRLITVNEGEIKEIVFSVSEKLRRLKMQNKKFKLKSSN